MYSINWCAVYLYMITRFIVSLFICIKTFCKMSSRFMYCGFILMPNFQGQPFSRIYWFINLFGQLQVIALPITFLLLNAMNIWFFGSALRQKPQKIDCNKNWWSHSILERKAKSFLCLFLCLDMPKRIKWLFADIDELVDKISFNILIWCQLFCQEIIKYKNKSIICWNFRISPGHGSLFSHAMKLSSQSAKKGQ